MQDILKDMHFSSDTWAILLPFILMGIDVLTGIINAFLKKNFSSSKMRSGLGKKIGEGVIIVLGELLFYAARLPKQIMNGVIVYICFMEFMSILENLDKLGVRLPAKIKVKLNNTDEQTKELEELIRAIEEQEAKEHDKNSD